MTTRTSSNRRARRSAKAVVRAPSIQGGPQMRARLLTAAEQIVRCDGIEALTISSLCSAARVSRRSFYAVFADRTDCVLALFDALSDRAAAAMVVAYRAEAQWVDGVRAALTTLLFAMDRSASLARFLIVYSSAGEAPMLARRAKAIGRLARALDAGRLADPDGAASAPFGAEAIVGAVASILHSRLLEEPVPSLAALGGPLMGTVVLPYLGVRAARDELTRPVSRTRPGAGGFDALSGPTGTAERLGIQVTARTVAALGAIARSPGISNREVADAAGITDAAATSRLLGRLRRMGLIAEDACVAAGARKAWRLTPAGHELLKESLAPGPEDLARC